MPTDDLLQAGIAAFKAGDLAQANSLLAQVVRADPRSEEGWLWLGRSRTLRQQRAFCFNQVLAINPGNLEAQEELRGRSQATLPAKPKPSFYVGVLWKPSREPEAELEPEAPPEAEMPPEPTADAQPEATGAEADKPPESALDQGLKPLAEPGAPWAPDLEPEILPEPAADAQPAAPSAEPDEPPELALDKGPRPLAEPVAPATGRPAPEKPPRPVSSTQVADVPKRPLQRRKPAAPRVPLDVGVLWKPPRESAPDLEPEAPPEPALDNGLLPVPEPAAPTAPDAEPEEPPIPAALSWLADIPASTGEPSPSTGPAEPEEPPIPDSVTWLADIVASAGEPSPSTGPDEPSALLPETAPAVVTEDLAASTSEAPPQAPTSPAQPRPKTALDPLWLLAGLGVIILACVVGLSLLWYINSQGGVPLNRTPVPALLLTPNPAALGSSPQPTSTSPFPTEWTKAPTAAGVSPTPRPSATTSAQKLATAKALVTQASRKVKAGDYEQAIDLLDQAIVVAPRYGDAYYQRASAGYLLIQYEDVSTSLQPALYRYLDNINQAVALDPPSGNYYLVRFHLEETLALVSPYRVDQDFWHNLALADIRQANELGNNEAYSERQPPFVLANLGRCQEAQDEVNQLLKTKPQPSGGLYSALAASDLCLKDAQSALKHIEAAINSQASSDRLISRVVILYSLGRWADARTQLDSLLKAQPDVCPCRYAWRALLDYKLGDLQMAQDDLAAAGRPTPPTEGVDAYIRGLLALQAGDNAGAVRLFQEAEAKLTRGDGPFLLEEIRQQLTQAGAAPLSPTISAPPTPAPRP